MTRTKDVHAEGYRVDLETDPLRVAAYMLAAAVADLLLPHNKSFTIRADTMISLQWLRTQLDRDPETVINLWTYDLMRTLGI